MPRAPQCRGGVTGDSSSVSSQRLALGAASPWGLVTLRGVLVTLRGVLVSGIWRLPWMVGRARLLRPHSSSLCRGETGTPHPAKCGERTGGSALDLWMKAAEKNKTRPCFDGAKPCVNPEQVYERLRCAADLRRQKYGWSHACHSWRCLCCISAHKSSMLRTHGR